MTLTPIGRKPIEFHAKDAWGLIELLAKHILEAKAAPLAPEVPPRSHDALYGQTIRSFDGHASVPTPLPAETRFSVAATRTPEPPDSGDGAAGIAHTAQNDPMGLYDDTWEPARDAGIDAALLERAAWSLWERNPAGIEMRVREGEMGWLVRDILREVEALRSGSPAPEGGE